MKHRNSEASKGAANQRLDESVRSNLHPMDADYTLPQIEKELLDLWSRLLEIRVSDARTDFFEVGGDSLLATRMVIEVSQRWQLNLTTEELINNTTLGDFASCLFEIVNNKRQSDGP